MRELALGIDLGTHGARTIAVDTDGTIHAQGAFPYQRHMASGGVQEQPLDAVWHALCESTQQILAALKPGQHISSMGVTHQRGTLVALGQQGQPAGPAICDSDLRSWPQAKWLADHIGAERLFQSTGCPPVAFNGLTKILWWYQEYPDLVAWIAAWMSIQDWVVLRLTGQRVSSPGSALRLGVLDITDPGRYACDLLAEIGINPKQLMPLNSMSKPLGLLLPGVGHEIGLTPGIPVFAAPGDQPAAVLGTGAIVSGDATINLGTSFLTSFPLDDIETVLMKGASASCTLEVLSDNAYAVELGSGAGTNVLDWLRTTLFELPSVEDLNELAESSVPGAHGITVLASWWSALGGTSGLIKGLQASHTRADIARATLEGLAYEVRWAWDRLVEISERVPESIMLFGGASQHDLLCQMLADVLQRPTCRTMMPEASALGAAICAATGSSWFTSVQEASRHLTRLGKRFEPQDENAAFYEDSYSAYLPKFRPK